MMKKTFLFALLTAFCSLTTVRAADPFYILPLFEHLFGPELSEEQARVEMQRMQAQIGNSRENFRTGFGGIMRNYGIMERNFRLAKV